MTLNTTALGLNSLEFVSASPATRDALGELTSHRRVSVTSRELPTSCPQCNADTLYRHGKRGLQFTDVPHYAEPTVLEVDAQRWRCLACLHTFLSPISDVDESRHCTKRLIEYVRNKTLKYTFAEVGREVGLDDKSIRHIFDDYAAELTSKYVIEVPRVLGIDEVMIMGVYRCMITNIEKNTIYDILETRNLADLRVYFSKMPDRDKVELVTADLWNNYETVAKEFFPKAKLVPDRFHVQRMATNAMEIVRKLVRKNIDRKERLKLKDERFLLLKNGDRLSGTDLSRLRPWLEKYPVLSDAWEAKEGFLAIWNSKTASEAKKKTDAWIKSVPASVMPQFRELINVMTKRQDQVLNYFTYRVTNAYTESINRWAKSLNRNGRGYSFEVFRIRMLYDSNALSKGSMTIREEKISIKPSDAPDMGMWHLNPGELSTPSSSKPKPVRKEYVEKTIYFGADIDTLTKKLEEGFFD